MPVIDFTTAIEAPIARCFDLARSIDFHQVTTSDTGEKAVAGRTTGLIEQGESVTWRAKHLGVWQQLSVRIVEMDRPRHFRDEMVRGAFARMCHDHEFVQDGNTTRMRDRFAFEAPLGPLGWLANRLFLEAYMRRFLLQRARILKEAAESQAWRQFVPDEPSTP